MKQNPDIHLKNSKAEVTSSVSKISTKNNLKPNYPQTSERTSSSNMEAPTPVELVQKKGFQPKQLVHSFSPEEQNTKTDYQSCSKVNYLSIKEDKIEGKDEHQELNTNNEDVTQFEELDSPIYVRVGWKEYPVMVIMNPSLEDNILPLKIGLSIGMKPKKENKTKNQILMKKVQSVMPTDETIYLPFTVEGSLSHLILGKKFCNYFSVIKSIHKSSIEFEESENSQDIGIIGEEEMKKKEEFSHSKKEEEGEKSLSTFKVNTFHSEGIYDVEHPHTAN
ncbi:hypothetical protein O181_109500 [Austropuccinia psidii MF-1]|uniref:Uncharacterized protein n=1 Tax=Austropuccinia psidii MF-1 TaxID=1389203 RepID=A0A9Q3JYK2_9BASI|nr:hypothetical protein [Austropuccinia psidii MF-1]